MKFINELKPRLSGEQRKIAFCPSPTTTSSPAPYVTDNVVF